VPNSSALGVCNIQAILKWKVGDNFSGTSARRWLGVYLIGVIPSGNMALTLIHDALQLLRENGF
jgi:hypothetical protein